MTGAVMDTVVVWNLDARHRPELEVEIDIVDLPDEIPGRHHATLRADLEVEIAMGDDLVGFDEDAWFLADDALVSSDDYAA